MGALMLTGMTAEVRDVNKAAGWYDDPVSFGEAIALLHSECSEALEGYRSRGLAGVGSELADVLIRLLDTAGRFGIDLQAEYDRKMAANRCQPYRNGGKRL